VDGIGDAIVVKWAFGWGTEGVTKTLSQDGQCSGRYLNGVPPENKPEASALERTVCWSAVFGGRDIFHSNLVTFYFTKDRIDQISLKFVCPEVLLLHINRQTQRR
jgi:hypothetical protein